MELKLNEPDFLINYPVLKGKAMKNALNQVANKLAGQRSITIKFEHELTNS